MIANPYTPIAKGEQLRAAKYLVGWMLHQRGKVVPPKDVDAMAFAKWMLSRDQLVAQRYSVLWLVDPHLADLYKAIVQSSRPMTAQELWTICPGKDRISHVRLLAKLRSSYTHWVKCDRGRYWATIDQPSVDTVGAYCGWLGALWKSVAPDSPNPWWEARSACREQRLHENHGRWGDEQVHAGKAARQWISNPTMLAARDAWLLCGIALLGLRATEIASALRSDMVMGRDGSSYVRVKRRKTGDVVLIGPAAASWLHRFEGFAQRDWGNRSKAFLESKAPLWPSLAKWGAFRGYLEPLRPDSVQSILRTMSIDDERKTWLTMLSLRSLLEGRFDLRKAEVAELMGRTYGAPRLSQDEADAARLVAQARVADELGLSSLHDGSGAD